MERRGTKPGGRYQLLWLSTLLCKVQFYDVARYYDVS